MNKNNQSAWSSRADEDASLWAVRLEDGSMTPDQRTDLEAWLRADPHHLAALESYCSYDESLAIAVRQLAAEKRLGAAGRTRSRLPWGWAWWGAGLATVAAAFVFALSRPEPTPAWPEGKWATAVGQTRSIALADQSTVELNAGSQMVAEIRPGQRRLRLVHGEAFFRVSKDEQRPFIIETPMGAVQVTGTAFNVTADPTSGLVVTVQEGSVRVSPGGVGVPAMAPVTLRPREQLVAGADGATTHTLEASELEAVLGWREGWAYLDRTPLQTALTRFSRYHGQALLADPSVADLKVGGRFALNDLEGFLVALESILPVRVSRDLNGTVRVGPREKAP